jgi:excisionase family DNA binding protein
MKKTTRDGRISIRELAALLRVSTDTIRRAFRSGEIPAIRVRTALRFDLDEVLRCLRRKAEARYGCNPSAPDGDRRPRAGATSPRIGNTGAQTTASIPGGQQSR